MNILKIIGDNSTQAIQTIWNNKLRSFLSLLGISIGIFCIIGVKSAVDSLEQEVKSSFDKLGDDILYIQKFPWQELSEDNFFKMLQRPKIDYDNYLDVNDRSQTAELVSFHVRLGGRTLKYQGNSVSSVELDAGTFDYDRIYSLEYDSGRWFTPTEYRTGANKAVIGAKTSRELFGALDPLGRDIKLMGHTFEIVGLLKEQGESLVNINNFDEAMVISYNSAKKLVNLNSSNTFGNLLAVKAHKSISTNELKDELIGILRVSRKLRPMEESNFAINNIALIAKVLEQIFQNLNIASIIIGGFAVFVGMFSVANIMFVSVKERTKLIGIKKALGAKKFVILLEFLIEAVVLCIIGGLLGLILVFIVISGLSYALPYSVDVGFANVLNAIILSIVIGVVAGLIPAYRASNLDPVVAIRK